MSTLGKRVLWGCLVLLCAWVCACGTRPERPIAPGAIAVPQGRGPALPGLVLTPPASPSKTPVPADHYAFAFNTAGTTVLARYRMDLHDVQFFPQAGFGVANVSEPYPYVILYDQDGDIFLYDVVTEARIKLVDGVEVGGFAFSPSIDDFDELWFLGTSDPRQAALGIGYAYMTPPAPLEPATPPTPKPSPSPSPQATGSPTPTPSPTGSPSASPTPKPSQPPVPLDRDKYHAPRDGGWIGQAQPVLPINAFAVLHGGITSLRIASHGDGAIFSTADGGLYLYRRWDRVVIALLSDAVIRGGMQADSPRIDPFYNRWIVWQDLAHRLVFVLDLWTGYVDPVPYLSEANGRSIDPDPKFIDAYEIVFNVRDAPDTEFRRLLVYNVLTETLWSPGALLAAFFTTSPP